MNKVNWWIVGIAVTLAALFFFGGGMMMGGWGGRGYGMMGYGMMGNWGYSPMNWFGMGLGMLFMWIVPVGVIALIVYGAVAFMRNAGNSAPSALVSCPHCGKGAQADWKNCPYCGTALK